MSLINIPQNEIEYIELLIESEKLKAETGWVNRVQEYNKIKEQAKVKQV